MDHYATLGVSKTATQDEIKKAYRKLAAIHHPDKPTGDTAKFQAIQAAYAVLSDERKRAEYDAPKHQGFQRGPGGFHFSQGEGFDLNELFRRMHEGHMHSQSFHRMPQLFRTLVGVTLDEVYSGGKRTMTLQTDTGSKHLELDIPKGVNSGDQVKYPDVIPDGVLIVEFRVEPHPKFERRGPDLVTTYPISVLDLIAGTTIEFTTLAGKTLSVNVPAKTQPNMQLKMAGQGLPIPGTTQFGNQYLLLKPFIPDNIHKDVIDSITRTRAT